MTQIKYAYLIAVEEWHKLEVPDAWIDDLVGRVPAIEDSFL